MRDMGGVVMFAGEACSSEEEMGGEPSCSKIRGKDKERLAARKNRAAKRRFLHYG